MFKPLLIIPFNLKTFLATFFFSCLFFYSQAQYGFSGPGGYGVIRDYGSNYSKPITIKTLDYFNNVTYKFKVTLLNDSVEFIRSKIYADTVLNQTYLIKVNRKIEKDMPGRETKIYAKDTKIISRELYESPAIEGIATDSCWLFKVVNGQISAYSPLTSLNFLSTYYLNAFQVADGPIQKFDPKELEKAIADNPKAKKAFDKKNYYKAINVYNGSE
ncbi:MAG: hypothetical protein EAY66_00935 [Sphingobacteriales bacterium]|nr:MAG: hypothetical protein EAY66_00935 [Sphingobacteriales bacterium]